MQFAIYFFITFDSVWITITSLLYSPFWLYFSFVVYHIFFIEHMCFILYSKYFLRLLRNSKYNYSLINQSMFKKRLSLLHSYSLYLCNIEIAINNKIYFILVYFIIFIIFYSKENIYDTHFTSRISFKIFVLCNILFNNIYLQLHLII